VLLAKSMISYEINELSKQHECVSDAVGVIDAKKHVATIDDVEHCIGICVTNKPVEVVNTVEPSEGVIDSITPVEEVISIPIIDLSIVKIEKKRGRKLKNK
jgi:hypothetical protein